MRKHAASFGQQLLDGAHARTIRPGPASGQLTIGDVIRGSIGAAMGAGVARGASRVLGLSSRMSDKVETIGMALGAGANTGRIKMASYEDRVRAFKFGAATAMAEAGDEQVEQLMKKIALVPKMFIDPTRVIGGAVKAPFQLARGAFQTGRSLSGGEGIDTHLEKKLSEDALHEMMLREKLDKLLAQKKNRILRQVLRGGNRG